jgi:hypothetical protein
MPITPSGIATPQEMRFRTGDGRTTVNLSGYAVFNFKGSGGSWRRDQLWINVGPVWRRLDDVCPSVTLASISNSHHAVNAGWAVDWCNWTTMGGRILLRCGIGIRDSDGYILRAVYHVNAVGLL